MQNKITNIKLGGKERKLLFGVMGFFHYAKEVTSKEPFEWINDFSNRRASILESGDMSGLSEDIAILIYSGLNCWLDANDQDNIDFKKVRKWTNGLGVPELKLVCDDAFSALMTDESGELQPSQEVAEV